MNINRRSTMRIKTVTVLFISLLLSIHSLQADDLGSLEELAEEDSTDLAEMAETSLPQPTSGRLNVNIGGYLKGMAYWNEEHYSDELWEERFLPMAASGMDTPSNRKINGFNTIGTRLQLKFEAFLDDKARLFSAFNLDFNQAHSLHDASADSGQTGDIRQVESYVEIYEGSRTWKIGSQIVTWGYLEGIEVPTDRVNARDFSYKSTEYEDGKLASTGILLTQKIWDSALDIMYIPIARKNVNLEFQDYFYTDAEEKQEYKPNNGKWATRFSSSVGNLDYALSYLEGMDPNADLIPGMIHPITKQVLPTGRAYNRVQSPGMDLQYNFGSWLAKASYVEYHTEDTAGDDYWIKNSWKKYVVGGEFTLFDNTINLYAGQHLIENFQEDPISSQTSFLVGQLRERTDFLSGHINASFLPGNALNLVFLAAGYWDEEGEPVQTNLKATITYKIASGLDLVFSPGYMDILDNTFTDYQAEIKYSF